MTRRQFLTSPASLVLPVAGASPPRLALPVHRMINQHARLDATALQAFSAIWNEAVRDLTRCGIDPRVTTATGEIKLYPSGRPLFVGLARGRLNIVLTGTLPQDWDAARAVAGVSTVYEGYHVAAIALRYAHGHRIPLLAVNTVLHEMLHFLLLDVLVPRPSMLRTRWREERVDWHATRMWLTGRDADLQESAGRYTRILEAGRSSQTAVQSPGNGPPANAPPASNPNSGGGGGAKPA
jgi:hypothetical protein